MWNVKYNIFTYILFIDIIDIIDIYLTVSCTFNIYVHVSSWHL